jgi:hypothetical protein
LRLGATSRIVAGSIPNGVTGIFIGNLSGRTMGLELTQLLTKIGKVKVKFTLEQATRAQRGSRGIALLFP